MTARSTCQTGPRLLPSASGLAVLTAAPPPTWPDLTWIVRPGGAHGARPALEIYVGSTLADVLVATSFSRAVLGGGCRAVLLGGGCRAVLHGRQFAIAWGHLTAGSPPPLVFRTHGPFRRSDPGLVAIAGPQFWVAVADGAFTSVSAGHGSGADFRRLRRIRP